MDHVANSYNTIGACIFYKGEYEKAIEHYHPGSD